MKWYHAKTLNIFGRLFCFLILLCVAFSANADKYVEEFQELSLEELQNISETLSKIINEKRIGNAILIVDPSETTVAVGKSVKLAVSSDERTVNTKTKINYESSDESVAKVSNGTVTGVGEGTAKIAINAVFEDGATLETSCSIHVYIPVTSIKAPQKAIAFIDGEMNLRELITIMPENATEKKINYSVDDESIVTVDENGILKGHKGGVATITVSSAQENPLVKSATIKISVDEAVSSIKLNKSEIRVAKGSSTRLEATVGPDSATNKAVEWKSENPAIATVSGVGDVSGKGTGTTTITCIAKDGSGVLASAKVTVFTAVTSVKITSKEIEMMNGETSTVRCDISPKDASNKKVKWSSDNSGIASIDENGRITAKKAGTCTITATAADGSGKTASINVYVEPQNPVTVNSIHWQTVWGMKNGKMGVYGKSQCTHRKIKSFTCKVECTSWYGGTATDYITYKGGLILPGKTGKGKLSSSTISGFTTAATIKITVTSVTFSDGTVYYVPSSEQETTYFSM